MKLGRKKFGQLVRQSRIEKGLKLIDLAELVGLFASSLSRFERGEIAVRDNAIAKIKDALELPKDLELRKPIRTYKRRSDIPVVIKRISAENTGIPIDTIEEINALADSIYDEEVVDENRTCLTCDNLIVGKSSRKYCSDICRNRWHNKNKIAKNITQNSEVPQDTIGVIKAWKLSYFLGNSISLIHLANKESNVNIRKKLLRDAVNMIQHEIGDSK